MYGVRTIAALVAVAPVFLVSSPSSAPSPAGTLNLRAALRLVSTSVPCPPEAPPDAPDCRARTGSGLATGLGSVTLTYTWFFATGPPTCPSDLVKPLASTGRLVVAGKGEIRFKIEDGSRCVVLEPVRNEPQDFTITGGTGPYEGASGSGTLTRTVSSGVGSERVTGTLVAPGVEFDVTPPRLSGAISKTVPARRGAKRVRVSYTVRATDAVDGQLRSTCVPRSGSWFRIGRTAVICTASDSSANTATSSFRVTVRRSR